MKKSAMIRARIEPGIKEEAETVFKELGLSTSEAIGLFYQQVKIQQGIPFEIKISSSGRKSKVADFARDALVKQSMRMTPNERLNAFLNHSYLLNNLENTARQIRQKGA